MGAVLVLASEAGGEKTLWDPTILGVLVVLSAVGLFCGSVYLLLSTNMGARLGFLVSAACLSGFIVLLSGLWITTATPLNSPHGLLAGWDPVEVLDDPSESAIPSVREVRERGTRIDSEDDLGQLRPGAEAALVRPDPTDPEAPEPSPFAEFQSSVAFLTDFEGYESYEVGGGTRNVFWHHPRYAVMQYCPVRPTAVDTTEPVAPTCDPLADRPYLVMRYDYGTLRQPPWIYLGVSLVFFVLSLLGLHWHEKDARERRSSSALQPVPAPST